MRRLPPLAAVRVFEAAARHGHFTRAGEELGMTQAAVSYQVKLLEERLGVSLFRRAGRQVVLTEAGRRIAPQVTGAFDALDDAFGQARAESESMLTISCSNTFAANWLALRLGAFQVARPGLAVRLHTSDAVIDLAHSEVDVAIRGSARPWPGLASHFLMRTPVVPMASPGFVARHGAAKRASDLLLLPRLSPEDVWWRRWFESAGVPPPASDPAPGLRLDSQVMEGNAAIAGQGVAILNPALWRHEIVAGRLVRLRPEIAFAQSHYWLVYPEGRRAVGKIRAFRDWLLAEIARDAESDEDGAFVPPEDARAADRS